MINKLLAAAAACMATFLCAMAQSSSSGWEPLPEQQWQSLLHLGADLSSGVLPYSGDGKTADNTDFLAPYGGEANQRPWPGLAYSLQGRDVVWTVLENPGGDYWDPGAETYVSYWHTTVYVPGTTPRGAKAWLFCDDDIRVWNNGAPWIAVTYSANEQDVDVTLNPGLNHITIKLFEIGGGDMMSLRLEDMNGQPFTDLLFRNDYALHLGRPEQAASTQDSATFTSALIDNTGTNVAVFAQFAPAGSESWSAPAAAALAGNVASFTFTGLAANTQYKARFTAETALDSTVSETREFELATLPKIVALPAAVSGTSLVFNGVLSSAGAAAAADVSLHWGATPALENAHDFGSLTPSPSPVSWTEHNLVFGATYYYAFSANDGNDTVWSATNSITISSREVYFKDSPASDDWDTTTANWNLNGFGNNNTTTFENGDSVNFPRWWREYTLTENVSAGNIALPIEQYETMHILGSAHDISFLGKLSVKAPTSNFGNRLEPRLTGSGRVEASNNGYLRLDNPGNDFNGGVHIDGARIDGVVESAGATPFGAGVVRAGGEDVVDALPKLGVRAAVNNGADGSLGALELIGDVSSVYFIVDRDYGSHNVDFTIGSLSRPDDGKATLAFSTEGFGGTAKVYLQNLILPPPTGSLMPPWMASTSDHGQYLERGADGLLSLVGDYDAANIFTNTTLAAPASHPAARLMGTHDLGGNTLSIGGAIVGHNVTVDNGAINFGTGDGYFFTSGDAKIHTAIAGDGAFHKFGPGRITLTHPSLHPRLVSQDGVLTLAPAAAAATAEALTGSAPIELCNAMLTLASGGDYRVNGIHLHSGGITVPAGAHFRNHGMFRSSGLEHNASTGSTVRIANGGQWTQTAARDFYVGTAIQPSSYGVEVKGHRFILEGAGSRFDMGGGVFILGGVPGAGSTLTNTVHITGGAVFTNAVAFHLAYLQGGKYSSATVDNGAKVFVGNTAVGGGFDGNYGGGSTNTLHISGQGTVWNNGGGKFAVGSTGGGQPALDNAIVITDGAAVENIGRLIVGQKAGGNSTAANNTLVISAGARLATALLNNDIDIPGGGVGIGHGGGPARDNLLHVTGGGVLDFLRAESRAEVYANYGMQGPALRNGIRVDNGGKITNLPNFMLGRAHASHANEGLFEILDGGEVGMASSALFIIGRAYSNQPNPAHSNGLHIASATAQPSILDCAGVENFLIGDGTSTDPGWLAASANANWARIGKGGEIRGVGNLVVGAASGNSIDNRLILNGGAIACNALRVLPENNLEVELTEGGILPVTTGSAKLESGSRLIVSADKTARAIGGWHEIIVSSNPIEYTAFDFDQSADNLNWKYAFNADETILSVRADNPGTVVVVR